MEDEKISNATAEVCKILGRGTPAGKALFNLYNKGEAAKVGNTFHDRNAAKHQQKLASGWVPTKPEKKLPVVEKPKVAVPHFSQRPRPSDELIAEYRVACIPHRRSIEVIRRQIDEEYERMRRAPMPPSKRPVLDEAEKDRLANLMRYRGKPPTSMEVGDASAAALRGPTSRRIGTRNAIGGGAPGGRLRELEGLFDAVLHEMDERRDFLRDLESKGALKPETLNAINREIRERVGELEKLDVLIKEEQNTSAQSGKALS